MLERVGTCVWRTWHGLAHVARRVRVACVDVLGESKAFVMIVMMMVLMLMMGCYHRYTHQGPTLHADNRARVSLLLLTSMPDQVKITHALTTYDRG